MRSEEERRMCFGGFCACTVLGGFREVAVEERCRGERLGSSSILNERNGVYTRGGKKIWRVKSEDRKFARFRFLIELVDWPKGKREEQPRFQTWKEQQGKSERVVRGL